LWISGSGLQRDYFEATGIRATGEAIITASRRGERDAVAAFERYAERLARSLACIVNLVDPEVIVLGGGMANVTELYALLPSLMRRHVFSDAFATRILQARWGDSSGVRGAARLWTTD
jgi:fructokinase